MATSLAKSNLASDLTAARDKLLAYCDTLSVADLDTHADAEQWTVKDKVGHLSFWEQFVLDCIRDTFKHGRPKPLTADSLDNDLNAKAAAHRKDWTWERVRAEFVNTRSGMIQRLESLDEVNLDFYVPSPWVNDTRFITIAQMIREDVLGHAVEHFPEIA